MLNRTAVVINLNFKKQEICSIPLDQGNQYRQEPIMEELSINSIKGKYRLIYISSLNDFNRERVLIFGGQDFYTIPDTAYKERHYLEHLQCVSTNTEYSPVIFSHTNNDKLHLSDSRYYDLREESGLILLNPFNASDLEIITTTIAKGIEYENEYKKEQYMEDIKSNFPCIFSKISDSHEREQSTAAERFTHYAKTDHEEAQMESFKKNILRLQENYEYLRNPLAAANYLLKNANAEARTQIQHGLLAMGCTDAEKTKTVIFSWISGESDRKQPVMEQGR